MNLNFLSRLRIDAKGNLRNKTSAIKQLNLLLSNSIDFNIKDDEMHGIAFSGGIDSTLLALLCKKLKKNFKLYNISVSDNDDLIWGRKAAIALKLPLNSRVLSYDEAYLVIKRVCNILKTDDPVKTGIGCVLYSVLMLLKEDKIKNAVTGLGSDSLFFGFDRHRKAFEQKKISEQVKITVSEIYKNDVKRETEISNYFNSNLICPYLDKEFVKYSMKIHPNLKINKDHNKVILRELAFSLGLKKELSYRKKLASQYGSGFDKAIGVLSRENSFKSKREFLNSLLKK